ncbi:MAG TPA: hypothetical protein VGX21_03710 [Methylomirabilota bacterium]|jgi:hypothetical protein|nr:hypothetical protein [Methylomirabilota bacterium]
MLSELAVLGGLVGFVVGVLELSHRLNGSPDPPLTSEAALREALRGAEAAAIRAEYHRRGIEALPSRPVTLGF